MKDYLNSKIYKIEPICDHEENDIYIGSTSQVLCKRFSKHKSNYACFKNGKYNNVSVFKLFEKYGIDNCKIDLIELYPCETKDQLTSREGHHIKTDKCINRKIEGRTQKEYYIDNIEKIKEYGREYGKEYYEDNKEEIKKNKKQYYEMNKEIINEKHICICGCNYTTCNKSRHFKSTKHQNFINNEKN